MENEFKTESSCFLGGVVEDCVGLGYQLVANVLKQLSVLIFTGLEVSENALCSFETWNQLRSGVASYLRTTQSWSVKQSLIVCMNFFLWAYLTHYEMWWRSVQLWVLGGSWHQLQICVHVCCVKSMRNTCLRYLQKLMWFLVKAQAVWEPMNISSFLCIW